MNCHIHALFMNDTQYESFFSEYNVRADADWTDFFSDLQVFSNCRENIYLLNHTERMCLFPGKSLSGKLHRLVIVAMGSVSRHGPNIGLSLITDFDDTRLHLEHWITYIPSRVENVSLIIFRNLQAYPDEPFLI